MLELYEQNRTNGATGSLANDPSPSEMHRGHAPLSSMQAPSTNGDHQYQSTSENPQAMESAADEVSSKQVEDKTGGTKRSSSPPSDRPSDARHKGTPEPLGGSKIMNGRIKQETTVRNKVLRPNGEKFDLHIEHREEVKFSVTQVDRNGDGDSAA